MRQEKKELHELPYTKIVKSGTIKLECEQPTQLSTIPLPPHYISNILGFNVEIHMTLLGQFRVEPTAGV